MLQKIRLFERQILVDVYLVAAQDQRPAVCLCHRGLFRALLGANEPPHYHNWLAAGALREHVALLRLFCDHPRRLASQQSGFSNINFDTWLSRLLQAHHTLTVGMKATLRLLVWLNPNLLLRNDIHLDLRLVP